MDVLTPPEMIAQEKRYFDRGITAETLMNAAGEAMVHRVLAIYPDAPRFAIYVGKGNNGGDGLVMARVFASARKQVYVVLSTEEENLGELPLKQLKRLRKEHRKVEVMQWAPNLAFPDGQCVVIDSLLGLQGKGPLRGEIAEIVAHLNAGRAARFFRTVAIDFPTGLAGYEDEPAPENRNAAVVADVTIAVGFAKNVLVREEMADWVGRLEVVPFEAEGSGSPRQVLVPWELAGLLPRRSARSYKGDFGKIAIIAGSPGFNGAPVLCAQAALATGVGLLSVVTHAKSADVVAATSPHEAMVSGWPRVGAVPAVVKNASAIVIGPGLGTKAQTEKMLRAALRVGCPVLIDADGINVLAKNLKLLARAKGPVILTPHIGEMARLTGKKFGPGEREQVARAFVDKHNVTLVLKGTRTLVTAPGYPFYFNTTGNPGLGTGGSGDTLSGIIGALLVQKLAPLDAARLGVWLHGHAADLVLAERGAEEGLTPTMLSAKMGAALASLRAQAVPPYLQVKKSK